MTSDDFSTYVAARGDALLRFAYVLTEVTLTHKTLFKTLFRAHYPGGSASG